MLYCTTYDSPLGPMLLAAHEEALVGAWLPGQQASRHLEEGDTRQEANPVLVQTCAWLDRYFAGQCPVPQELPLDPQGSAFRRWVWQRLCCIPYGQLETYGQIARELAVRTGGKMSAQAVGGAVGHNPISIIIPCHRVVGTQGNLVGYGGGLALKRQLLSHEGVDLQYLHDPRPKAGKTT